MIRLRISSSVSDRWICDDAAADRPKRERDSDRRPLGDSDRPIEFARVLTRVESGGLELRIGRLVVDISGDSSLGDDLVLETCNGGEDASDGGCWSGSPLSGVVMDFYRLVEEREV